MVDSEFSVLKLIEESIKNGDIDVASKIIDKYNFSDKFKKHEYYLRGMCLIKKQNVTNDDYKNALKYFENLNLESLRQTIIVCKFNLERYEDIVKHFMILSENDKLQESSEYLNYVAMSCEKLGMLQQAISLFKKNSNDPKVLNSLLILYMKTNNYKDFSDDLIEFSIKNKDLFSIDYFNNLALYLLKSNQLEKGFSIYKELLEGTEEFKTNRELKSRILNNYIYQLIHHGHLDEADNILDSNYLSDETGIQAVMLGSLRLNKGLAFGKYVYEKYINQYNLSSLNLQNPKSQQETLYFNNYRTILSNHLQIVAFFIGKENEEVTEEVTYLNDFPSATKNKRSSNNNVNKNILRDSKEEFPLIPIKEHLVKQEFDCDIVNNTKEEILDKEKVELSSNFNKDLSQPVEIISRVNENNYTEENKKNENNSENMIQMEDQSEQYFESNKEHIVGVNNEFPIETTIEDEENKRLQEEEFLVLREIFEKEKNDTQSNFEFTKEKISQLETQITDKEILLKLNVIISFVAYMEEEHFTIIEKLRPFIFNLNDNTLFMLKKAYIETKTLDQDIIDKYIDNYNNTKNENYIEDILDIYENLPDIKNYDKIIKLFYLDDGKIDRAQLEKIILRLLKSNNELISLAEEYLELYYNQNQTKLSKDDNNRFIYLSGMVAFKKKNNNGAFENFLKIENNEEYQKDIEFLKIFAKTCVKLKNNKKAIKLFKKALELDNMDFESSLGIGECNLNLDFYDKAKKYLSHCEKTGNTSDKKALLFFAYGRLYYKKKEYVKAIEQFQKCLEIDPYSFRSLHNTALIYICLNDKEKAEEYLTSCIKINPEYKMAQYELLTLKVNDTNTDKKDLQSKFEKLIDSLPQFYLDFSKLCLEYFDDIKVCIIYLKKYFLSKELNGARILEMIDLLIKHDYCDEAYSIFQMIIKKTDRSYAIYSKISNLMLKKKKNEIALNIMKQAANENPTNFLVISKLAYCLMKTNDFEAAIENYIASEELYNNEIKYNGFLKHLCYCYCETGKLEQAKEEMIKHNSKMSEENNNLILSAILLKQGKEQKAIEYYGIEKEMFPNNPKLKISSSISVLKEISFKEIF